jgi:molecular chaperone GrpE (heat shock protein)
MLDGAVDSLRRLLGQLLEQRLESVARDVAEVRREVAGGADGERVLALLDGLLHALGASRFTAEPLDVVDPLIHAVVEERRADGVPAGVILEAVRPGFRSGRGLVLAKAAVTVSGG